MAMVHITVAGDGRSFLGFKRYKVTYRSGDGHLTQFRLTGNETSEAVSTMLRSLLVAGGGWTLTVEKDAIPAGLVKTKIPGVRA